MKLDGIVVIEGDRVLIQSQLSLWERIKKFFGFYQDENGVYVVIESRWEVPDDDQ